MTDDFQGADRPSATLGDTDWASLREAAIAASSHAYVPYSKYPVGAAALVDDGRVVTGCNVENASYGLTLCAECALVGALHGGGGGKLVAFVCVNRDADVIMPCGRCRQLLHEHAARGFVIETPAGIRPFQDVLPQAFGPDDLEQVGETP